MTCCSKENINRHNVNSNFKCLVCFTLAYSAPMICHKKMKPESTWTQLTTWTQAQPIPSWAQQSYSQLADLCYCKPLTLWDCCTVKTEQYITCIFFLLCIPISFTYIFSSELLLLSLGPYLTKTKFHLFVRATVYKTTISLQKSQSKMWTLACPLGALSLPSNIHIFQYEKFKSESKNYVPV